MDKNETEHKLSDYIDTLNDEKEPEKHHGVADSPELEKYLATIRLVRSLKEPILPDSEYPHRLAQAVADNISFSGSTELQPVSELKSKPAKERSTKTVSSPHKWFFPSAAALVAGFLIILFLAGGTELFNRDVVYAMGKAVDKLSSYHGVMEMTSTNAAGEKWMVRRVELWSEGDKYAVKQNDDTLTVNNGDKKWQVRPQNKEVALLPLVPDPSQNGFNLRDEAKRAIQYPHTKIDSELIAGRQTQKLVISPPGGLEYYLWIDAQTNLPIQLQTAMQNALQTTYTFVNFEPNTQIDPQTFTYQPPTGYKVVEKDPGQLVTTVKEAAAISQLTPLLPQEVPARIFAFTDRIVLDYGDTTLVETNAKGALSLVPNSALGSAAGGALEVWGDRLRWRQYGIEIQAEGTRRIELARQIAPDLTLPDLETSLVSPNAIKVPIDIDIVKADQQQVDAGHVPWQLDPLQVALTFANLKLTPAGIVGEPLIGENSFKLAANNGAEAVVDVTNGPVKRVYLQRLVRQDETGIWSVVAYDPR